MKFSEFQKLLEDNFETSKLADIAREIDVTPQVINNWKSRDQVPYKYVKKIRDKILDNNTTIQSMKINNPFDHPSEYSKPEKSDSRSLQDFIEQILELYYDVLANKKYIIYSLIVSLLISIVHIYLFSKPIFESTARILPVSDSNTAGLASFANQFGVNVGRDEASSLADAELYPDIIESRRLASLIILEKFKTKKYSTEQELINILNDTPLKKKWSEYEKKIAINKLLNSVKVSKSKKNPLVILTVTSSELDLTNDILDSIINNLIKLLKSFKVSELKEKKNFIKNRIIEVEKDLIKSEDELKVFREKNRKISFSPALLLKEERHQRLVEVQKEIYITLRRELEMAQIDEYDGASLIQILDPPESKGDISMNLVIILLGYVFLGLITGISVVLILKWYKQNKVIFIGKGKF